MSDDPYAGYTLLPAPPKSKDHRHFYTKKGRIPNEAYTAWRNAIRLWMMSLCLPMLTGRIRLDWILVVPDLIQRDATDNAISGVQDCATGVLWKDDSQIWGPGTYEKRLDRERKDVALYFRVTALDAQGSPPAPEASI